MPKGDVTTARVHRDWLQQVSKLTGKSLTKLASETRLAVSTLTRPVKEGDSGTSTLHAETIRKLSSHTGIAPPVTEETMLQGPRRPLRGFLHDAERYTPDNENDVARAVQALIAGHAKAEPWVIKTRALELAGYLPGDVVIVDPQALPQLGSEVCALLNYDRQRGTADTVMRVYERAGSADILVAASMDPIWRQPIAVDDRVQIRGVIVGMVRPPKITH